MIQRPRYFLFNGKFPVCAHVQMCKCVCTHHCPHVEVRGLLRVSVLTFPACMIHDLIATVYIRLAAGFWEFSCFYRPSPWSCSGITDMHYQVLEMFWKYRHELPCSGITDMYYHVLEMFWDYRHVLGLSHVLGLAPRLVCMQVPGI